MCEYSLEVNLADLIVCFGHLDRGSEKTAKRGASEVATKDEIVHNVLLSTPPVAIEHDQYAPAIGLAKAVTLGWLGPDAHKRIGKAGPQASGL